MNHNGNASGEKISSSRQEADMIQKQEFLMIPEET
jgi:hypothetical protein